MRAFIAVDIPWSKDLDHLYAALRGTEANLKIVEPENVHVTLKFLGDIDTVAVPTITDVMRQSVAGIAPFQAALIGVGVFPNEKKIRVLWLGLQDEGQLVEIMRRMDEALNRHGFKKEKRYVPHATVARMKSGRAKAEVIAVVDAYRSRQFGNVPCESIVLKESRLTPQGPIYNDVEVVPL
jgi:2'-5' RNA ligase